MSFLNRIPLFPDAGLLVIRLFFGLTMAFAHGYGKILNLGGLSANLAKMGFPLPGLFGPLAGLSEFLGGILIALGLATRASAATLTITMLVAAFIIHADDPFGKKELALCYAAAAAGIALAGAGRFSLDRKLFSRKSSS